MTIEDIKIRIANLLAYAAEAFYAGDIDRCDRLHDVAAAYRNLIIEIGTYE